MDSDGGSAEEGPLVDLFERLARGEGSEAVSWTRLLSGAERARLRSDAGVLLAEHRHTGEPFAREEALDILAEFARSAGWDGPLVAAEDETAQGGSYAVAIRDPDLRTLEGAPAAVREAAREALSGFLHQHPTAAHRLPRGRLKKLPDRGIWQLHLPDGFRLRYLVDEADRVVHVLFLGPHPDGDPRGREAATRASLERRRHGGDW